MNTWLRRLEPVVFHTALLYAALLLFSVNYLSIIPGLDPSWAFAMNLFAHGPPLFGKDIIFTYGPLAYLAIPQHVGSNIQVAAVVHVAVWAVLIYLLLALRESGRRFGALAFTVALICSNRLFFDYWDYLICALILIAFLLLFRKRDSSSILLLLSLATGASFLIKFTSYAMAMLLLSAYSFERFLPRQRATLRERILLALAFASGPIAYLLYNPSLSGLLGYVRASLNISTGFSTSMSIPTEPSAAWHAAMLSLVLLALVAFCLFKRWIAPAGAVMVLITMWVSFKHGFVRSEHIHQAMFYCFLLIAFAFLLAQMSYSFRKAAIFASIFAAFTFNALQGANLRWPVWTHYWWSPDTNLAEAAQLLDPKQLYAMLDNVNSNEFRTSVARQYLPAIKGKRVLFFPWDVSNGSVGGFTTVPLFTTQAYHAYTQFLDKESANRLQTASPPIDYVLFEWKSIDYRHPLLDVPAVWNVLYTSYFPAVIQPDSLLLKRRAVPLQTSFQSLTKAACPAGEWISVPPSHTPIALSLNLKPTLAGSLLSTLYQVSPIALEVRTRSGITVSLHIPPNVVASPFPINYLPLDLTALNALWTANTVSDPVVAFRVTGPGLPYIPCRELQFYSLTGTSIRIP